MLAKFHPTDSRSRWRRAQSMPAGASPVPSPPESVDSDTIYIRWGYYAQVTVFGRDDGEVDRDIENATFVSTDPGIVRVVGGSDTDMASLYPVSVGTTTVTATADAAAANEQEPVVPITKTLTVVVYRIATQLVLYYTEDGATDELLIPLALGSPSLQIPVNTNATIRVEGQDAAGNVVPLTGVVFDDFSSIRFHFEPTADPSIITIVTDANGFDTFDVTADSDPSPGTANLTLNCGVAVHLFNRATHLAANYSIVPGSLTP